MSGWSLEPVGAADTAAPAPGRARRWGRWGWALAAVILVAAAVAGLGRIPTSHSSSLPPPALDGSQGYRFLHVDEVTGLPARFDPCAPVPYVVNPDGAPDGVIDDVHEAFRRAALATGMTFTHEGASDEVPGERRAAHQPGRYGDRWAPILVGWIDIPAAQQSGKVMGWAANVTVSSSQRQDVVVTGVLALNRSGPAMSPGFGAGRRWGNVALHEIGHLLGLDHVAERGQVMTTHVGYGAGEWGAGDLAGLAYLGREAGCLRTPAPSASDADVPTERR